MTLFTSWLLDLHRTLTKNNTSITPGQTCFIRYGISEVKNLEEVKELLNGQPSINAESVWKEVQRHRSDKSEKLDLDELEAVSGGADCDWKKDICAVTCEWTSWCFSNDLCFVFDVTYDNFWATCPNHEEHLFYDRKCVNAVTTKAIIPSNSPFIRKNEQNILNLLGNQLNCTRIHWSGPSWYPLFFAATKAFGLAILEA